MQWHRRLRKENGKFKTWWGYIVRLSPLTQQKQEVFTISAINDYLIVNAFHIKYDNSFLNEVWQEKRVKLIFFFQIKCLKTTLNCFTGWYF